MSKINYHYIVRYLGDVFHVRRECVAGYTTDETSGKQSERTCKIMIK